jgi:hypothetical protein
MATDLSTDSVDIPAFTPDNCGCCSVEAGIDARKRDAASGKRPVDK